MNMNQTVAMRNVFALCAVAMVVVMVMPCHAAELEAGRYQWQVVPHDNKEDSIYVIDTKTGEVAGVNRSAQSWFPVAQPLDWTDIRNQQAEREKQKKEQAELREKQKKAAQAEREALLRSFSEMSLEEQVAWAENISVRKRRESRYAFSYQEPSGRGSSNKEIPNYELFDYLKGGGRVAPNSTRGKLYKSTDDGIVVRFSGVTDGGGSFSFGLSHSQKDTDDVFPAPETIIEDVKAEIKRQAEKRKEDHAENH